MTEEQDKQIRLALARLDGWCIKVDEHHYRWLQHGDNRYIAQKGLIAHGAGLDGAMIVVKCDDEAWDWALAMNLIPNYTRDISATLALLRRRDRPFSFTFDPAKRVLAIDVDGIIVGVRDDDDFPAVLSQTLAMKDDEYVHYLAENNLH